MHKIANKPCFVIAEAGVNHNGSVDIAHQLIDIAADARADAVKFQTFKATKLVRPGAQKADYQQQNTSHSNDQLGMLQKLELPENVYPELMAHCAERGIQFISTPFDDESAQMLVMLGMSIIKIPSGEITNLPFLKFLAGYGLPIILSTGMSSLDEVDEAIKAISEVWKPKNISMHQKLTLLHCTSNYPAQPKDVNLRAMLAMEDQFQLPVGYSDHTLGIAIPIAAVAMGATVIEKHFTLDCKLEGPDHRASLSPEKLRQMVIQIREVEFAFGSGVKMPVETEFPIRDVARRSVTLTKTVSAGQIIDLDALTLMRPGNGIAPKFFQSLVGKRYKYDLPAWTTLTWEDIQE